MKSIYMVTAYEYGDGSKRRQQLELLEQLGLSECEKARNGTNKVVICNAEQALILFNGGYCGNQVNINDSILPIYTEWVREGIRTIARGMLPIMEAITSLKATLNKTKGFKDGTSVCEVVAADSEVDLKRWVDSGWEVLITYTPPGGSLLHILTRVVHKADNTPLPSAGGDPNRLEEHAGWD